MKTIINKWPALLFFIAGLIGVAVLFKSYDFLLINEVKALISVVFGFASSCILLSLIWLLQKKPIHESWHSPPSSTSTDSPNMHPRASLETLSSSETTQSRFGTIKTISSAFDKPPNYEDALINSKPVNSNYIYHKGSYILIKTINPNDSVILTNEQFNLSNNRNYSPIPLTSDNFRCIKHINDSISTIQRTHLVTSKDCSICLEGSIINPTQQNNHSSNSNKESNHHCEYHHQQNDQIGNTMAQLALSIVRGFTSFDSSSSEQQQQQQVGRGTNFPFTGENSSRRKPSYCQLDVSQLMQSSSPPKYSELSFDREINFVENNSNEPRAG